ncbi:unnamed protein product [Peniophora sp. CBMAI 1063]|nr:unnamed protein product [Peniophora sp. CBMAI 1063]
MSDKHHAPQPEFIADQDAQDSGGEDDEDSDKPKDKKTGRRKIKIEFIQDKSRRHITFSKRKAGIMKKAYELSTLTGTQVLLLVVSETGLVYTFTTAKLQPLVTQPEGKNLIQACLNAPHGQLPTSGGLPTPSPSTIGSRAKEEDDDSDRPGAKRRRRSSTSGSGRPRSPQSPASGGLPQPLAIPPGAPLPQMMGTPTGAPPTQSPAQPAPPASPHYTHSSPGYPPAPQSSSDVYGQPMMQHPQSAYYPPPAASGQWPGAVQGGQPHYAGRR